MVGYEMEDNMSKKSSAWFIGIMYVLAKIDRYYGLPEWVEGLMGFVLVIIVAQVVWNGFQNWRAERQMR